MSSIFWSNPVDLCVIVDLDGSFVMMLPLRRLNVGFSHSASQTFLLFHAEACTQIVAPFTVADDYTYLVKTVLVVDDDAIIRKLVHDALSKRYGWVVLEAEDGIDGVARFMLHHPDILITDITMPNSDGFEMLDVLEKGKFLEGVKVIIMSGIMGIAKIKEKGSKASALLSKPFNLHELFDAVGD